MVESAEKAVPHAELPTIAPTEVRYIKLGDGGRWATDALQHGYVAFGYHEVSHEMCARDDEVAIRSVLSGRASEGAITAGLNEVRQFYQMDEGCLWITFANGYVWWCFAETEIVWISDGSDGGPSRCRPAINGWRNTDVKGRPLKVGGLSSKLTKTANFRATICKVPEQDYLLRRINAIQEPVVARAHDARAQMLDVAEEMVRGLHWADFETLTDLIFARSGWQRSTRVGDNLTDIDIALEQPTTGETAFVQIKSVAGQRIVDEYLERFRAGGYDRFFFVCHSARGVLSLPNEPNLHLFQGRRLADAAVKNGLFDWLMERSG
ncbi:hypothetical protein [Rhizorhabdus wittichii]|uniref:hypothetical protein n=1 Tax=Rhizorhabdus wittichii TaxID=160791 RepID=UPI00036422AA|nr:hypothetical protein [Rhizorhabdus wittichii]